MKQKLIATHFIALGLGLSVLRLEQALPSENHITEDRAIQIANAQVKKLGQRLNRWRVESGSKAKQEWLRMKQLRREYSSPELQDYLDRQERALDGAEFFAIHYKYRTPAGVVVKHGEMWVFLDTTGKVLLIIPPGH